MGFFELKLFLKPFENGTEFFFEYASSYKVHLSGTDKNLAQLEFFFYLIIV